MGYSLSPVTIDRMSPYLVALATGDRTVFRTPPGYAKRFSYQLREALACAAALPTKPVGFDSRDNDKPLFITKRFTIRLVSDDTVLAEPSVPIVATIEKPGDSRRAARVNTTQITTADAVLREWMEQGETGKLYLPNTFLPKEELLRLFDLCQENGIIFFDNAGALTLLPLAGNEETADYAWTPEDLNG